MSGSTISVSWGDLNNDAPGNYQIFRATFPKGGAVPDVLNTGTTNPSNTSQVNPDSTVTIPDIVVIPEPTTLGLVAAAGLLAIRRRQA
jgi:hypothetical protein